jgi:hypothetical protein
VPNPYSGFFQESALGLMRVSLTYRPYEKGVAPGIAFKFLQDSKSSLNVSVLTSLDNQGQDYNIFKKPFTNIVAPSKSISAKIIAYLFKRAAKRFNGVSVAHFSKKAPMALIFIPKEILKFPSRPARDFREDLKSLSSGRVIMDVYAMDLPRAMSFDELALLPVEKRLKLATMVGSIGLDSRFVSSEFGDNGIFFFHERF